MSRVYLDWNASAPLRPEARAAMLAAMDAVGNPSSVHGEGRKARAIVENARARVADLVGAAPDHVRFTSGATEAAMLGLRGRSCQRAEVEHDCVTPWTTPGLAADADGRVRPGDGPFTLQAANSETGVLQQPPFGVFCDATQAVGKLPVFRFPTQAPMGVSAHKLGGPKGAGAYIGADADAPELGHKGTENVIGIAGFGAAAEAAQRDLEAGVWDGVEKLRNILEETLADAAADAIFFGQGAPRLPNTTCFAVSGWAGETQVMQMDLAGFAVSAGSACSSGKVQRASRVLLAMGFDEITASSAIRVSMGPTTTEAEVRAFADAWIAAYKRRKARAA